MLNSFPRGASLLFRHLCILFVCFVAPTVGVSQVDFESDILPIFETHCFACHSGENRDGDLLLDSIENIKRGGHTGNALLSKKLANSELYLRVSSTSDGYRMPKKGDPLSDTQIERIGDWVKQYSLLNEKPEPQSEPPKKIEAAKSSDLSGDGVASELPADATVEKPSSEASVDRDKVKADSPVQANDAAKSTSGDAGLWAIIGSGDKPKMIGALIVIGVLLVWLVLKGVSRSRASDGIGEPLPGRSPHMIGWTLLGVFNTLLLAGFFYFYNRCNTLELENVRLEKNAQFQKPTFPPPVLVSADNLPVPPHPMHPARLGGTYYRGNDERDESLYNNGFYRTATIELHLIDSSGSRLKWSDKLDDEPAIEITIKRAPQATRELFTQRVLKSISIEHFCQTDASVQQSLNFEVVEEEQVWTATVPLPKSSQWQDGKLEGMIYLMYGVQPGDPPVPRPHFGIRYRLQASDMTIDKSSELWMGSLYTLGGRVLVPNEKQVLLDRWFDWRPIPVIKGDGSKDAELLGLPEHSLTESE